MFHVSGMIAVLITSASFPTSLVFILARMRSGRG
jgi:hypothetical protein